MKIDFEKERDTFLGYCMINAITHKYKGNMGPPKLDGGGYEVQFTVNGVELPLIETFKDIENQIDRQVAEKALELLIEKFGNITDITYEICEELKRTAKERLGLKLEEY